MKDLVHTARDHKCLMNSKNMIDAAMLLIKEQYPPLSKIKFVHILEYRQKKIT